MGTSFQNLIIFLSIFVITILVPCVSPANILVYGAISSHSTQISMIPFVESLADKGHSVTFLVAFENNGASLNQSKIQYFTPKILKEVLGEGDSWEEHYGYFHIRKNGLTPQMLWDFHNFGVVTCQALYSDPEFIQWIKTTPKFDLVIMEYSLNECAYGLAHYFNAKLVVYGTSTVFTWCNDQFGLPDETSSIADVIFQDFPNGDKMTFFQRIKNAVIPIMFNVKRDYDYFPTLEQITRNGLGLEKNELPSFREIERNTSLVLLTTHFTLDHPRSLPPHVIPIGGAVIASSKPLKPLPKEMKDFLDSAKSGFIYISFGSMAEFTNFDREVQLEFINALFSFPEIKFLWKAAIQINETLPHNVMLTKWAPQQTVLAHPNIKAFISHCGKGSMAEAIHFSVPMVLLPVLEEQDSNSNFIDAKGAGIKLEIVTLKKHELENAISEILNNKRFRDAMKKLSNAFKDRPSPPIENAVWWVEYILRHENSNDYLVPLSIRQPWWKRRQIDVWLALGAFVLLVLSVSLCVLFKLTKKLSKVLSGTNKSSGQGIKLKSN